MNSATNDCVIKGGAVGVEKMSLWPGLNQVNGIPHTLAKKGVFHGERKHQRTPWQIGLGELMFMMFSVTEPWPAWSGVGGKAGQRTERNRRNKELDLTKRNRTRISGSVVSYLRSLLLCLSLAVRMPPELTWPPDLTWRSFFGCPSCPKEIKDKQHQKRTTQSILQTVRVFLQHMCTVSHHSNQTSRIESTVDPSSRKQRLRAVRKTTCL